MGIPLRILQVEDSASDAALIVRYLEKAGYTVEATRVDDAAGMQAALAGSIWDAVIADYSLPQLDAPAALALLQRSGLDLPFIVVSGTIGEEVAVAMMKAGAHDYLMKDKLARLAPAVKREIGEAEVRRERRQAEQALRLALTAAEEGQRLLDTVFNTQTDGVFVCDAAGMIIRTNPAAAALFGFDPTGARIEEVIPPTRRADDVESSATARALRGETTVGMEFAAKGHTLESSAAPMRDGNGKIVGAVTILRDITERRRVEEERHRSERRYQSLFQHMGSGFLYCRMLYDPRNRPVDFIALEVNEAFERLTGLSGVVGRRFSEIVAGARESMPDLFDIQGRVASTGEAASFELDFKPLGRWFSVSAYSPEKGHFAAIVEDITERKRHETDREAMVALLKLLNSPSETPELIASVTALLREWTGCEEVAIRLGEQPGPEGAAALVPLRSSGRTIGRVEFHDRRTGRFTPELAAQMERAAGSIAIAIEQRQTQDALRASNERYRLISENTADVIWLVDAETGRYTFVSPSVEHLLGYTAEEMMEMDARPILASRSLTGKSNPVQQLKQVRKDGAVIQTEVATTWLPKPDGRGGEILGVTRDITARAEAEARLAQAQKLESVGRLAGGVAHDFNNLITVINGYSEMMLEGLAADDPLRDGLDEIRIAGERATMLSRQLLTLSRKQVVQPKPLDVNGIIVEVMNMLGRVIGEDIRLDSALDREPCFVMADPGQLHQVLMNLAINSRDAMPDGGTLRLETLNVEGETDLPPGLYVRLRVSDTGTGMSREVMEHLFEPFFTTKSPGEGTGLGLATVYGIVQQSGGTIRVASEIGRGTNFDIYLPRIQTPEKVQSAAQREAPLRGTETILLVEDQDQLRRLVARVLRARGYQVMEAAHAEEALRHAGAADGIDLLLTDIVMPGLSGLDLALQLKPTRPAMKVLFMSGYSERAAMDRQALDAAGAYMAKPITPEVLTAKVREVLGAAPPRVS